MSFKSTYILFAILGVMLAVFVITQLVGVRNPKDRSTWVFLSMNQGKTPLRSDEIGNLLIERTGSTPATLNLYRGESGWRIKEPDVRLDTYSIDRIVDQIIRARREEKAELTQSLADYGLDKPRATVTLTKRGGDKEWVLHIGKESETGGDSEKAVYVLSSDRPKEPLAVKRSDLDQVFKNLNDFRSKSLLADSAFDIQTVSISRPKKETVGLEKTPDSKWRFTKPAFGEADYEGEPAGLGGKPQSSGVRELLQAIADI